MKKPVQFCSIEHDGSINDYVNTRLMGKGMDTLARNGNASMETLIGHMVLFVEKTQGAVLAAPPGGQLYAVPLDRREYALVVAPYPAEVQLDNGRVVQVSSTGKIKLAKAAQPRELTHNDAPAVEVTFLTNACGEDTGYGSLMLADEDYAKVPFESGPGVVLPYIVEIEGEKYVLGNLEVAYKDKFWGDDGNSLMTKADAKAYCAAACNDIQPRLASGMRLLPIDEGDPGRLIVGVAIPLDGLADRGATFQALQAAFGKFADIPDLNVETALSESDVAKRSKDSPSLDM